MDETLPTFGESLRERRRRLGLSQRELARGAGLSLRALRNIEQGRVRRPNPRSLRGLSEVLGRAGADVDGPGDPPSLAIGVLGPLRVAHGRPIDLTAVRVRSLLALLAIQPGQVVPVDEIADVLWAGRPPRSWSRAVPHYVWRLRGLLEPGRSRRAPTGILTRIRDGYRLDVDAAHLDLLRFDALSARARRASARDDPGHAMTLWTEALRCWRGPVLAGLGPELRQHPAAVAAAGRRVAATLAHADLAMDQDRLDQDGLDRGRLGGGLDQAVEFLRAVAADEPLHEGLHARLMVALAAAGQQAAALATFTTMRTRLADELGVEPGAELRQAHLRVLRHDLPAAGPPAIARARGPVTPAQLPPDVPAFAGRDEQLWHLDGLLASRRPGGDTAGIIAAIDGSAGVGKTTLAVHWAHRVADRFGDGQLYVNLRGFDATGAAMGADEALRGFLSALGVPNERIPTAGEAQVGLYRSLLAGRRLLIVLDNARDAQQIRPLLPGTPDCLSLVTSRTRLTGLVATNGAHPVTVDVLSRAESRALLSGRLGSRRVDAEPDAVGRILDRCAGLPLALAIVCARAAAHPRFPLAALAGELGDVPSGLEGWDGGEPATDIRAVLSWSYRTLTPAAARLFRQVGLHPGADITVPAAASLAGVPPRVARRLFAELTDASLVREHAPGRFTCHDLLRAYAVELAHTHDADADRAAALIRVLAHYIHTADVADRLLNPHRQRPGVDPLPSPGVTPGRLADGQQALAWFGAELPVLLAAVRRAAQAGLDRPAWQLAGVMAMYLDRQSRWPELHATQRIALDAALRDGDVVGQAHAHRHLAAAHLELGHLDDALVHYGRAVELFDQTGDRVSQAYAYLGTAMVCDRRGGYADALRQAELALRLYRRAGRRPGQAHALNSIAWYRVQLGDHRRAVRDGRRALAILDGLGDANGSAHTWDTLGYAYHRGGQHRQALACYEKARDLFQDTGERYYAAGSLDRLGDARQAAGDPVAARDAWRRALTILDELDHPEADDVRAKLAPG